MQAFFYPHTGKLATISYELGDDSLEHFMKWSELTLKHKHLKDCERKDPTTTTTTLQV